ncbi:MULTISPECIES: hypothetical protein [unclassified Flavobacterium]|uniref:hypothetical protein n=1 Tax=unclassified Flavobacterium TaxID=196869 RepID=UPI001F13FE4D|nr:MULTISPECIES: hypothetical protein [unclassified Flavobacterium]UMY67123.1 hypothetical protein MKO97_07020 [Flavobacterium sp. HJ-32-4]
MEETYIVRRGLTDNAKRKLHISPEAIRFENKNRVAATYTTLVADDITDFRFGINWYVFKGIPFGREYRIFVRTRQGEELKIHFNSYFGRHKKAYIELYGQIVNSIWKNHFARITQEFLSEFEKGETFRIGDVVLHPDGLLLKRDDPQLLPWKEVRTANYATYFSIYSEKDPMTRNHGFSYHLDWNTEVLKRVVNHIIKK